MESGYPLPALGYAADRVPVDTVLSYCRYTLLDQALPLDGELVGELQAALATVLDTAWPSGRPENNYLRGLDA